MEDNLFAFQMPLFVMVRQTVQTVRMKHFVMLSSNQLILGNTISFSASKANKRKFLTFQIFALNHSNKYYRVAERSSGAWETKCIAKERATKLNKTELKYICKQLGYDDVENVLHRIIDPIGNVTHIERNYPRRAVKISTRIPSSTVKLNDNFNVTLIPSSRSARPIEWNQQDENSCFQLEIICDKQKRN